MAARRISKSAIDWAKFAEMIPENQKKNFLGFRSKSEGYLCAVFANPENLSKIDFNTYRQRLPNPKIADEFEAKYKAVQIPYPKDTVSATIDAQAKEAEAAMAAFKAESAQRVEGYRRQITEMEKMIPVAHMTMEDYMEAFPECAWDPKKPTYFPHTPEIQEAIAEGDREKAQGHH